MNDNNDDLIKRSEEMAFLLGFVHASIYEIKKEPCMHCFKAEELQELYDKITPQIEELFYKDDKEMKDE